MESGPSHQSTRADTGPGPDQEGCTGTNQGGVSFIYLFFFSFFILIAVLMG